jgi:putrescine importer
MGSGMGSQLAAGRLLCGMGRGNALPKSFFGAIEPKRRIPRIPRNNILLVGVFAFAGADILEFFSGPLGGLSAESNEPHRRTFLAVTADSIVQ